MNNINVSAFGLSCAIFFGLLLNGCEVHVARLNDTSFVVVTTQSMYVCEKGKPYCNRMELQPPEAE